MRCENREMGRSRKPANPGQVAEDAFAGEHGALCRFEASRCEGLLQGNRCKICTNVGWARILAGVRQDLVHQLLLVLRDMW